MPVGVADPAHDLVDAHLGPGRQLIRPGAKAHVAICRKYRHADHATVKQRTGRTGEGTARLGRSYAVLRNAERLFAA